MKITFEGAAFIATIVIVVGVIGLLLLSSGPQETSAERFARESAASDTGFDINREASKVASPYVDKIMSGFNSDLLGN